MENEEKKEEEEVDIFDQRSGVAVVHNSQLVGNTKCVSDFIKIQEIGQGTFGTVFKAKDKKTNQIIALKKVRMGIETDGFPITALREIQILQSLSHINLIKLNEVVVGYQPENIFLVLEYCSTDIANLIDYLNNSETYLNLGEIKCLMLQLLCGLSYLHKNNIIHRDLKFSNLLITQGGILKLADFGLTRKLICPLRKDIYTPKVVTLWYRAPEILINTGYYGKPADVWAVGCILAEFLDYGNPLFPGNSEVSQFECICEIIGKPSEKSWPDFLKLPVSKKLNDLAYNKHNLIGKKFYKFSENCKDLLSRLLTWDPTKRITIDEALMHDFFNERPYPVQPAQIRCLCKLDQVQKFVTAANKQFVKQFIQRRRNSQIAYF